MNIPEGWDIALMAEMERRFEIRNGKGKWHDEALAIDDTQIGVEFAIDFIRSMLAAAPTPPAQEAEPTYQVGTIHGDGVWMDVYADEWRAFERHDPTHPRRILYTHPQSDKLREAATEILSVIEKMWPLFGDRTLLENLRKELESK